MTGFIHIRGRNFNAGCLFDETGTIWVAAPILYWAKGLRVSQVILKCKNAGYYYRIFRDKPQVS